MRYLNKKMEIETLPIITHLERFVEQLPKEHRAEAYRLVESFYHVGAGDGAMAGLLSTLNHNTSLLIKVS